MNRITVITIGLFLFTAASAQTQVPHDFAAGTPARAAEVNANFDAIESAVDQNASAISSNAGDIASNSTATAVNAGNISDNAAAIANNASSIGPVQVLANGESVGTFLQWSASNSSRGIWAMSSTGYLFGLIANNLPGGWPTAPVGSLHYLRLYYEYSDCTGPAYVKTYEGGMISDLPVSVDEGVVFSVVNSFIDLGHYYVPPGSVPTVRQIVAENPGCSPYFLPNQLSVEAFPNDPTITDVPNESFTPPITLGH